MAGRLSLNTVYSCSSLGFWVFRGFRVLGARHLARVVLLLLLQRLLHLKHLPPLLQQARGRRHMLQHQRVRYLPMHRHQGYVCGPADASLRPLGGRSLLCNFQQDGIKGLEL